MLLAQLWDSRLCTQAAIQACDSEWRSEARAAALFSFGVREGNGAGWGGVQRKRRELLSFCFQPRGREAYKFGRPPQVLWVFFCVCGLLFFLEGECVCVCGILSFFLFKSVSRELPLFSFFFDVRFWTCGGYYNRVAGSFS